MTKYNWTGTGPDGCDSHCIPHPCGPCITGYYNERFYLQSLKKKRVTREALAEELEDRLRDLLTCAKNTLSNLECYDQTKIDSGEPEFDDITELRESIENAETTLLKL